jgi:Ser/Thr protein kinase RdoA (MazF antagonist)
MVLAGIGRASADAPLLVLHGDAHAGNVMRVGDRGTRGSPAWAWLDLEETTRGPAGWDLSTLTARYDQAGAQAAMRGYAAELAGASWAAVPELAELAPFRQARDLEAAVWLLCMAHLYPERYAAPAEAQLSAVIAPTGE